MLERTEDLIFLGGFPPPTPLRDIQVLFEYSESVCSKNDHDGYKTPKHPLEDEIKCNSKTF